VAQRRATERGGRSKNTRKRAERSGISTSTKETQKTQEGEAEKERGHRKPPTRRKLQRQSYGMGPAPQPKAGLCVKYSSILRCGGRA